MLMSSKCLSSLLLGTLLLGTVSCGSRVADNPPPEPQTQPRVTTSVSPQPSPPVQNRTAANTVTVTVYKPDSQCEELIPEQVSVSQTAAIAEAVGKTIEYGNTKDFDLSGYRVNVDPNSQIATVDLRLSPDSQRQFVSLSSCERLALFGSLQKTLTSNSQWQIQEVRFTQQGEEIVF